MDDYKLDWYGGKWKTAALDKAAPKALVNVSSKITNEAKRNTPVFMGNLRRAISFWLDRPKLTSYIGFTEGNANAFEYAMAVERGRKAGSMPPSSALELWVKRKLKVPEKLVKGIAFVIARKIGREGTKPRPFLLPAFDRHAPTLNEEIQRQMAKAIEEDGLK